MWPGADLEARSVDNGGRTVEGAIVAADAGLDVFGILVLSFSTALIGGVARDLLIGAVPPQAIKDWRYPAVAFAAGAATFLFHHYVVAIPQPDSRLASVFALFAPSARASRVPIAASPAASPDGSSVASVPPSPPEASSDAEPS